MDPLAQQKLDDLLNDINMNCEPLVFSKPCYQCSVDCLALIRHKLPPVAQEGLDLLINYLAGRVSVRSITEMRAKCWRYLNENHKQPRLDLPVEPPEVCAVR